jgi:hypothetical protein
MNMIESVNSGHLNSQNNYGKVFQRHGTTTIEKALSNFSCICTIKEISRLSSALQSVKNSIDERSGRFRELDNQKDGRLNYNEASSNLT